MRVNKLILACAVLCFSACFSGSNRQQTNNQTNETPSSANSEVKADDGGAAAKKEEKNAPKIDCTKINTGDKKLLKKQTFPVDFPPFENSCFVTSHEPEYTDPPLGSEYAIYKDGKKIFDFPEQLAGATCWVEAVAFEDLNEDNLKEITVAGKCGAKMGDYNENRVYVNTGKAFTTDNDANYELDDFSKIKEINDFVRKNKKLFFR
jgi:hypothetical protein